MRLRGKSTTQSHRAAIYFVDNTTRDGMKLNDAVADARVQHETRISVMPLPTFLSSASLRGKSQLKGLVRR